MTASEEARPQRRVGTFTLGVVLVAAGCWMLGSLFWPKLDIGWMLRLSPAILIALGVEVLLAARGGGRIKYDWLGMLLCFLLAGAGLALYAAAWYYENGEFKGEFFNAYDCSRYADETTYRMNYEYFDGFDFHTLYLEAGEVLQSHIVTEGGWLEAEVSDEDGESLLEAAPLNGGQRFEISRSGEYTILVHGRQASGSFLFEAARPPIETTPEEAEGPEEVPEPESGT